MRNRLLALAIAAGIGLVAAAPADATPSSRIAVHFDLAKGQQPENIALAPDGTAYVTFASARQIAAISPSGAVKILATLPDGGTAAPVLGFALTTGIVRVADGTLYFLYASGDAATTGLYRLNPGRNPHRIAALPANGLPNGLAYDEPAETFYLTDSVLGTISTVPLKGGIARTWSSAKELAATGFLGANGIKVRHGAVWATNLDQGTLLRIPIKHGRPGPVQVKATGLAGIDDIAFTRDEQVIATLNAPNKVVRIDAHGHTSTLLTAGLQNPTSVAVRGRTLYVLSAAYLTATDPNLILASL
ncbi:SMP-30/gluconolactonase/LRE family protein [Herbidospora mongoliensis]|uniref:SMP-30/gluconolactonase/LRE family protein n=1 Tax=Herbidospora mongoliensis TaxID=688067 RepID=UPI00082EE2A3|nr:SMP-30/gluconolactonase/LRE family protein [Herbidospora mongoliensis]